MKFILITIIALTAVFFSGCSTVFNTTTQMVELNSVPPNAKITVDGNKFGTSPQKVNLQRGDTHIVRFELDGFDPYEIQLTKKMSSWIWMNVMNGFIPGWIVDMFSGSMYNLLPDRVEAQLTPAKVVEQPVKKK
jgi:hypothetical protein